MKARSHDCWRNIGRRRGAAGYSGIWRSPAAGAAAWGRTSRRLVRDLGAASAKRPRLRDNTEKPAVTGAEGQQSLCCRAMFLDQNYMGS